MLQAPRMEAFLLRRMGTTADAPLLSLPPLYKVSRVMNGVKVRCDLAVSQMLVKCISVMLITSLE